jgi:hypothetical protein
MRFFCFIILSLSLSLLFLLQYWVWTQGLHLEPFHQPFFVLAFFLR